MQMHMCDWPGCNKIFKRQADRKRHLDNVHLGLRPHECHSCQRYFAQKSSLKIHMNSHNKTSPYKCKFLPCTKRFRDPSSRNRHHKEQHGNFAYKCPVCSAINKRKAIHTKHYLRHFKVAGLAAPLDVDVDSHKVTVSNNVEVVKAPRASRASRAALDTPTPSPSPSPSPTVTPISTPETVPMEIYPDPCLPMAEQSYYMHDACVGYTQDPYANMYDPLLSDEPTGYALGGSLSPLSPYMGAIGFQNYAQAPPAPTVWWPGPLGVQEDVPAVSRFLRSNTKTVALPGQSYAY